MTDAERATTVADTVASIIQWLRSPDMDGHCHTHKIAQELARGDWLEWLASQRQGVDRSDK